MATGNVSLRIGERLAIKRNFLLFGTVVVGVLGFILTLVLVDPTLKIGWPFWVFMFAVSLVAGYLWALVMWHLWLLPLMRRVRERGQRSSQAGT
jgi:hypothetical protein